MPESMEILNALTLFANFVLVPGLAYGSQLALGALGVDAGVWYFALCQLRSWRFNGIWNHGDHFGDVVVAVNGREH